MNQITVYSPAPVVASNVNRARSKNEIIDRIRNATAAVADIYLFLRELGHVLDKSDLRVVQYALARGLYREGKPMSLSSVSVLARMSEKKCLEYYRRLQISVVPERVSNQQVSSLLTALPFD